MKSTGFRRMRMIMKTFKAFVGIWIVMVTFGPISINGEVFGTLNSGLTYEDLEIGTGMKAETGDIVTVHMTGWLGDRKEAQKEFFSSYDRNMPLSFKLGTQRVMQGWNLGITGMKVGGRRTLWIPSELAYGAKGVSGIVPPNTNVTFVVELLEVKKSPQ